MVEHSPDGFITNECGQTVREDGMPIRLRKKTDNKGPSAGTKNESEDEHERMQITFSDVTEGMKETELVKIAEDEKKRIPESPEDDLELREELEIKRREEIERFGQNEITQWNNGMGAYTCKYSCVCIASLVLIILLTILSTIQHHNSPTRLVWENLQDHVSNPSYGFCLQNSTSTYDTTCHTIEVTTNSNEKIFYYLDTFYKRNAKYAFWWTRENTKVIHMCSGTNSMTQFEIDKFSVGLHTLQTLAAIECAKKVFVQHECVDNTDDYGCIEVGPKGRRCKEQTLIENVFSFKECQDTCLNSPTECWGFTYDTNSTTCSTVISQCWETTLSFSGNAIYRCKQNYDLDLKDLFMTLMDEASIVYKSIPVFNKELKCGMLTYEKENQDTTFQTLQLSLDNSLIGGLYYTPLHQENYDYIKDEYEDETKKNSQWPWSYIMDAPPTSCNSNTITCKDGWHHVWRYRLLPHNEYMVEERPSKWIKKKTYLEHESRWSFSSSIFTVPLLSNVVIIKNYFTETGNIKLTETNHGSVLHLFSQFGGIIYLSNIIGVGFLIIYLKGLNLCGKEFVIPHAPKYTFLHPIGYKYLKEYMSELYKFASWRLHHVQSKQIITIDASSLDFASVKAMSESGAHFDNLMVIERLGDAIDAFSDDESLYSGAGDIVGG